MSVQTRSQDLTPTPTSGPADGSQGHGDIEEILQPIPEAHRTRKLSGQFWIWAGANVAPINWILGALGIQLGLGLADTLIVLIAGNVIGMLGFGFFVLLGQRTGATGMLLARGAFGRRGAYLPAAIQATIAIGWSAVNTWVILDLIMAMLGQIGWVDPAQPNMIWKIGTAALIMAIQVAICYRGYGAISKFERLTMPPTILVLIAMSVVAWTQLDIDWSYMGPPGEVLEGMPRIAAMSSIMTAIGIGWGVGWFTYAPDYSRFVSKTVRPSKLYLVSVLGQFIPVVWLGVLGASLATRNGSADPGELIVSSFGVLAVPVILLVIHGPIATNIINLYTFGVAVQALDINISRKKISIIVGCLSMSAVIGFLFASDFAHLLHNWIIAIAAWVATWGGIMAVHYFVFERRHRDFSYLFQAPKNTVLKAVNPAAMIAFAGGIIMTWMCMYGSFPILQGPIAAAVGGVDFSWLAGTVTASGLYFVLGLRRFRDRIDAGVPLGLKADIDDEEAARRQDAAMAVTDGDAGPDAAPSQDRQPLLHATVDATTEITDDRPDADRIAAPVP
ncbi:MULTISPECIES: cytosine permease [Micrococcaceae]|uniref:purine-cytosine permease family protein n=1 Tax=Micrococcaceae TaxID=1268 RepID=UPI00160D205D|nr:MULTISPECIES: cytosine permease [Micrococcaceae]MBB5750769.1 toxin CptA [Micrococcus sp. TA1]HRO31163.1 cytosine permease [Citricoccus sp.]HRO95135.1 cytosine permease [Citricoccus sp.]